MVVKMAATKKVSDLVFRNWVLQQPEGKSLLNCYQCGRCTGACPVAEIDSRFNPRYFLQQILLADESLTEDQLVWTCLTCEQCEVRCPEHVKIPQLLILAKVRGLAEGNTPQTALDRAKSILTQGRTIEVSPPMIKTREKMGLPEIGTPPIDQMDKMLEDLGLKDRLEKVVSKYGGEAVE
jgi:heterodisulfide reductase subunit C